MSTAAGDQQLTAVTPGNGDAVATVPTDVELVFRSAPTDAVVEVRGPDGDVVSGTEQVDGEAVTADVPDAGPGDYVVSYTVGALEGQTGFTVLRPGEAPPATDAGASSLVVTVALAAALAGVLVLTLRRWTGRGRSGR